MADSTLSELLFLIRGEFVEIPGLQLTQRQVEHLWGIDAAMAAAVLNSLVESHFLTETPVGTYKRNPSVGLISSRAGHLTGMRQ